MVCDTGAQHGVPGPVLEQQIIPPDVDHSRHMLVPVPGQHGCISVDVTYLWHMLVHAGLRKQACAHNCRMDADISVMMSSQLLSADSSGVPQKAGHVS